MKKKLLFVFFIVIFVCAFCLTACSLHTHKFSTKWESDSTYHWHNATCKHTEEVGSKSEHTYGEWEVVTPSTENSFGQKKRICSVCGYSQTEKIDKIPHSHTFFDEWTIDESYHWHKAKCEHSNEIADKNAHNFVDGVCDSCGYVEKLTYVYVEESDSFIVSGLGKGAGSEVDIPLIYLDKPVNGIANDAFKDCVSITGINIPTSIKTIGDSAFQGLIYLKEITVPESVQRIGAYAFYDCRSLSDVVIPSSVERMGAGVFRGCSNLESLTLPFVGGSINAGSASENTLLGYLFGKNMYAGGVATEQNYSDSGTAVYYIPIKLTKVTVNGGKLFYGAFSHCEFIKEVIIGNGVTEIDDMAFNECDSLAKVIIGNRVVRIGRFAFCFCRNLMSVTIGKSVFEIDSSAFEECHKLVEVYNLSKLDIEKGSDENGKVALNAFDVYSSSDYKSKIKNVNDGYIFYDNGDKACLLGYVGSESKLSFSDMLDGKNYDVYKYAFYGNTILTDITIGDNVTAIGDRAFFGCESIERITIAESVTAIGSWAFAYCVSLNEVKLPSGISSISYGMFSACRELKSVTIPDGVDVIEGSAFWNCRSLEEIIIQKSVTDIGDSAFFECISLSKVYYEATADEWDGIVIKKDNDVIQSSIIYYFSETKPTESGNYWHYENGKAVCWDLIEA